MNKDKLLKLERMLNYNYKKNIFVVGGNNFDKTGILLSSIYDCKNKSAYKINKDKVYSNVEEIYREFNINESRDKVQFILINKFS